MLENLLYTPDALPIRQWELRQHFIANSQSAGNKDSTTTFEAVSDAIDKSTVATFPVRDP
jgi:predicted DNA-binding transcriptional regulator YafY